MALIIGSDKNGTLLDTPEADTFYGGAGRETLLSTGGNDNLAGGGGADILDGRSNPDPVRYMTGDYDGFDNLDTGSEADTVYTGDAGGLILIGVNDTVVGGAGPDSLSINLLGASTGVSLDLSRLGSGAAIANGTGTISGVERVYYITGSNYDDTISAPPLKLSYDELTVFGGAGNDVLTGNDGYQNLIGGAGADRIFGGDGVDLLRSDGVADSGNFGTDEGSERDWVYGGGGIDYLICGAGDTALGGSGYDGLALNLAGRSAAITLDVRQMITAEGVTLFGAQIAEIEWVPYLYLPDAPAGMMNRVILSPRISRAGDGCATVGGNGVDHIRGSSSGESIGGGGGSDELWGYGGRDGVLGGDGNDRLHGGAGNDFLRGDDGDDWLSGDAGSDELNGGAGNDTLVVSGKDFDLLVGDVGVDTVVFASDGQAVYADLRNGVTKRGDVAVASLSGIENATGTTGDDVIIGSDLANKLIGGAGNDVLSGFAGRDVLVGGAGDDQLAGGAGLDKLTGGAGADRFRFEAVPASSATADRITDFQHGSDQLGFDRTAFGGLAANADGSLAAEQFALGPAALLAVQRLIYDTATGILRYDADGNGLGKAQVVAVLVGAPLLTADDILLV